MGQNSGAHIELTTISGTNKYHGQVYEYFQNSVFDAAPTFLSLRTHSFRERRRSTEMSLVERWEGRSRRTSCFSLVLIRGSELSDALNGAFSGVPTLPGLTDANRDPADLVNLVNFDAGLETTLGGTCTSSKKVKCITSTTQVDPVALAMFHGEDEVRAIPDSFGWRRV